MIKYFRKVLSIFLTDILILPVTVASGILIARYLGPNGKGMLTLIVLISTILKLLGSLGMEFANVYFTSREKNRFSEILFNNVLIWSVATVFWGIITLITKDYIIAKFLPNFEPAIFNYAIAIFPFMLWFGFALSLLQGLEDFKEFNYLKLSEPTTKLIAVYIFIYLLNLGIKGGAIAILLSYLIPTLLSLIILSRYIKSKLIANKQLLKNSIKYGIKGHLGVFFQFFNYRLDMFLVNYFLSVDEVGFYSLSVMVAELIWYIPNSISLTLFPQTSRKDKISANVFTTKISRNSITIMVISAFILGLFSKFLIRFLYGNQFSRSVLPLQILLPGIIAFGLVKIYTNHLHGCGKPQYGSIVTICSLAITVLLDLLLIPRMSIIGAALATTIAYSLSLFLTIIFFVRESGLQPRKFLTPSFEFVSLFHRRTVT